MSNNREPIHMCMRTQFTESEAGAENTNMQPRCVKPLPAIDFYQRPNKFSPHACQNLMPFCMIKAPKKAKMPHMQLSKDHLCTFFNERVTYTHQTRRLL